MAELNTETPGQASTSVNANLARRRRRVARLCGLYLAAIVAVWVALAAAADRWWVATVLMYMPKWVLGVPLLGLAPLAARMKLRRPLLVLAAAAVVLAFPISRFCIPWRAPFGAGGGATAGALTLRVITCNADHNKLDAAAFAKVVADERPDVVVLQDYRTRNDPVVFPQGWQVRHDGELTIASRGAITDVPSSPDLDAPFSPNAPGNVKIYSIATPAGGVRVINVHLATPRHGLEEVLHRLWRGAGAVRDNVRWRGEQMRAVRRAVDAGVGPTVVAGDLNTPTTSALYRECWGDLTNAFSTAGWGFGQTHLTSHTALRVDHILAAGDVRVRRCSVGPDVGSAHRPVIAELEWPGHHRP